MQNTSIDTDSGKIQQCRFCQTELEHLVVDLGMQPLCESYVPRDCLHAMEPFYPLKAYVCDNCFLVQVLDMVSGEDIYSHYGYFSSYSDSWLKHIEEYVEMAVGRFSLDENSKVCEVASNDGYLLKYMAARNIPVLGIEPAGNVAEVAIENGIPTLVKFFGEQTAKQLVSEGTRADLLIANNVFGHVPDLNDFVNGFKTLLAPTGVLTIEIPHILHTFGQNQFDQIYQEHYSYFSLIAAQRVFEAHGLRLFDVDELSTHGGSLRYYVRHQDDESHPVQDIVSEIRSREIDAGYENLDTYYEFSERVRKTKRKLLEFLIQAKSEGKQIVGYGAPGKGNTLLNYCGIREDFLDYTVDRSLFKQGKFLPGTHIPIYNPEKISETKPDYILLLPWNIKDEIMEQLEYTRAWGAKFIVPIPELEVC